MAEVLVIGVGNPLRGDDAAGLEVVRQVRAAAPPRVAVLEHDGEPASLLEAWTDARSAIVIDAVATGQPPGTMPRIGATAAPLPAILGGASTQAIGVAEAVELGRALGRLPERLVLFCIEGGDFGPHQGLTSAVELALDTVIQTVLAELAALRGLS